MNARLARALLNLYPLEWRARYRGEFQSLLETYRATPRTILNVAGSAIREHIYALGRMKMDQRQHSLSLMLYAYLAAIAAGVNFYWTVDGTPLAAVMRNHAASLTSWNMVRAGCLLAFAAVAIVGIPVFLAMLRWALSARRWDVLLRLAAPFFTAMVILGWMAAVAGITGGHWIPTPWDVTGDWTAPRLWPPLATRWICSSVTFALMAAGLALSARNLRQAIRLSDLSKPRRFWFTLSSALLAVSIALMASGVLSWGWFAQRYAASDFHARNGGFFSSTNAISWAVSCAMFFLAAVIAVRGTRSALSLQTA